MNLPLGMALDPINRILYIAEQFNHIIRMINLSNNTIQTLVGDGSPGYSGDGGLAIQAKLNQPFGIAIDLVTNIMYIAERQNNIVRCVNLQTNIISTFAGNVTRGAGYSNGIANNSLLNGPVAIEITPTSILIADKGNNCVRSVDKQSNMMTKIAGTGVAGRGADYVFANNSALNQPYGLSLDSTNNLLYIADQRNNIIRMVNLTTNLIFTIVGSSVRGYNGDGNNATDVMLNYPSSIQWDATSNLLYIMDQYNNVVRTWDRNSNWRWGCCFGL
ncbi:hypothetical protein AKO1_013167 [Acrasis kona]|uniref:NHL repeat containing protein n=1 Tax=Acrasis kona TaxID=1008807 RepID=A0AAW2YY87_9EUKA